MRPACVLFAALTALLLSGCADIGENIESISPELGVSQDSSGGYSGTFGGKIVFRDRSARRLPNYSKDK